MHIKPLLSNLPSPPNGKTGWPWDEEFKPQHKLCRKYQDYPTISLITPVLNQGNSIEETIRSVLLQNYPNLEYYIIDGGSSDQTIKIIQKYSNWLSGWISEKDSGQSNAINKGFRMCTGEIFNWLCSDDYLAKGAIWKISQFMNNHPQIDLVYGDCILRIEHESNIRQTIGRSSKDPIIYPYLTEIWQPSCFYRTRLIKRINLLREDLHYCMDRELWNYIYSVSSNWKRVPFVISTYRFTGNNKSVTGRMKIINELCIIYRKYYLGIIDASSILTKCWIPLVINSNKSSNPIILSICILFKKTITLLLLIVFPKKHISSLQKEFYKYFAW
jgi:glycosyltransferase involved in cell wall biosynthesis